MGPVEEISSYTLIKASWLSQESRQASQFTFKENKLWGLQLMSTISALACSSSSTHVVWVNFIQHAKTHKKHMVKRNLTSNCHSPSTSYHKSCKAKTYTRLVLSSIHDTIKPRHQALMTRHGLLQLLVKFGNFLMTRQTQKIKWHMSLMSLPLITLRSLGTRSPIGSPSITKCSR